MRNHDVGSGKVRKGTGKDRREVRDRGSVGGVQIFLRSRICLQGHLTTRVDGTLNFGKGGPDKRETHLPQVLRGSGRVWERAFRVTWGGRWLYDQRKQGELEVRLVS